MNHFRDSVSAIASGNLAKRGREWLRANESGASLGTEADVQANYPNEYPTERAVSTVILAGYQRPNRSQSGGPLRLVLRYDTGPLAPAGTQGAAMTSISLSGVNVVPDGNSGQIPGMVEKYYLLTQDLLLKDEGIVNIFVQTANSTQVEDMELDMKLELWVDENHQDAFALDPKEVFFDQFITRLQELTPGLIRTGGTWTFNNTASPTAEFVAEGWLPDWTERSLPSSSRWSDPQGVPWEVQAWLANKMQVNLWVNLPFFQFDPLITDDTDPLRAQAKAYAQGLGALMKDELDPNLKLYVEHSNEAWNSIFTTNKYLVSIHPGNTPQDLAARQLLFAQMTADMFNWFMEGFYPGGTQTQTDTRVQLLAMGHSIDVSWATAIATELQAFNLVDALGCTLYFPPTQQNLDDWRQDFLNNGFVTDSRFFTDLQATILDATQGLTAAVNAHAVAADTSGLKLYMYEGGPSLIGMSSPILKEDFRRFQNTQLMADLVTEIMIQFVAGQGISGTVDPVTQFCYHAFCNIQDSLNGDFLAITDLYAGTPEANVDTSDQHKLDAIIDFNDAY